MPRIPTSSQAYSETTGGAFAPGLEIISDTMDRLIKTEISLRKQRDERTLVEAVGAYETKSFDVKHRILTDADIPVTEKERTYLDEIDQFRQATLESFGPGRQSLSLAYDKELKRRLPRDLITFKADLIKLMTDQERAGLDRVSEEISKKAAVADPTDRDRQIMTFVGLLDRAEARGIIDATDKQARIAKFREGVLLDNMNFYRLSDRRLLFELDRNGAFNGLDRIKRLEMLVQARRDLEHEEARNKAAHNEVVQTLQRHYTSLANQGGLSDAEIEEGLAGRNPLVADPDYWRRIKEVNENPPSGGGSLQVRAIMQEYHSGPSTISRINEARRQLTKLSLDLGKPNKLVNDAFAQLQAHQRAEESTDAVRLNSEAQLALNDYRSRVAPESGIGGIFGRRERSRRAQEEAELFRRVKQGEKRQNVVEDLLKRRKQTKEHLPQGRSDVQQYLRGGE